MNIIVNTHTYPLISATGRAETMRGFRRDVLSLIVETSYANAIADFVEGATFVIRETNHLTQDPIETEYTDYGMAGPITDNRDGTCVVKMGKNNTSEQDAQAAQQAAEAETAKVSQALVTLAGKTVQESDIPALRLTFEAAADKLSDSDAKIAPSLTKAWTLNEAVTTGQRRYYATDGNLYKALQDHTTSISTFPDVSPAYWQKV